MLVLDTSGWLAHSLYSPLGTLGGDAAASLTPNFLARAFRFSSSEASAGISVGSVASAVAGSDAGVSACSAAAAASGTAAAPSAEAALHTMGCLACKGCKHACLLTLLVLFAT